MVEKEKVYYEFTGSVDDRNRVVIPNAIAHLIKIKKGDKVTVVIKEIARIQKGAV